MSEQHRRAWDQFWTSGTGTGCAPNLTKLGHNPLETAWREFAKCLPRKAKVIDLATGDGTVLGWLRQVRRDLKLVGVDYATVLPFAPAGITLKPGISIEHLPFADASFDAVTSQFGFEYACHVKAAAELARVLKSNGSARLIVHHRDGAFVRHNAERAEALIWASGPGVMERAKSLASARAAIAISTPSFFRQQVGDAMRQFPRQPVATEFTTAVYQILERGLRDGPGQCLGALAELQWKAEAELQRIEALCAAACDGEEIGDVASVLRKAGIVISSPTVIVTAPGGSILAWLLEGKRGSRAVTGLVDNLR